MHIPHQTARRVFAGASALGLLGLLGGCGVLPSPGGDPPVLDVWLMQNSASDGFVEDVVADFETRHEDVTVRVTVQEWSGIGEKVTEALGSDDGPDVIEVGNTQVAQYVETGNVRNLTTQVINFDGRNWLPGLAESGQVYGHQFGIPYYAANRVVIYRTDLFEAAGYTEPPRNRAEWLEMTAALDQAAGQQGIYLPGQNWFVLAGFIWDEGGTLAQESSGVWNGTLHTEEALAGMEFYAELQALGDGPKDSDEATPDQAGIFAEGNVAQVIATPGTAQTVTELNPQLAGKLAFFPVPGKKAGTPGAVFTGGSNLIIREGSDLPMASYEFVRLLTSDRWQTELATEMSYVPSRITLGHVVEADPGAAAMVEGATRNGHTAPQSARWGDVEADNPLKEYQTAVLTGADPEQSAREASDALTTLLNGYQRPGTADGTEE